MLVQAGAQVNGTSVPEVGALYPEGKAIVEMPYARAKAYCQVPWTIREKLAARVLALCGATVSSAA